MTERCDHFAAMRTVVAESRGCTECEKSGDSWVHLRVCLTCGHVGCCDDSRNRHASHHFHATRHPLIRSFEPGESWGWCYVDELFFEHVPGPSPR